MALADDFRDTSRLYLPLCSGFHHDAREVLCPTRSRGETYMSESFANVAALGGSVSGTGTRTQLTPGMGGTANPAAATGVQLDTGATLGSAAWVAWTLPHIPASYGVMIMAALWNVSDAGSDALWIHIQNTVNNGVLMLKFRQGGIFAEDKYGVDHQVSHHCPPGVVFENWQEVDDEGNGTTGLQIYQGTQLSAPLERLELPTGNPANAGLVVVKQQSAANNHQRSALYQLNIGETQLADEALIVWSPYVAPFDATWINVTLKYEATSVDIEPDVDVWAEVLLGGQGTFHRISMIDVTGPAPFKGILDKTKDVRRLQGSLPVFVPQGQTILPRVRFVSGVYGVLTSFDLQLTSNE